MSSLPLSPIRSMAGRLAVPGDKSISHRYVLLGALASGRTRIGHLSPGADVRASLQCVSALGAQVEAAGTDAKFDLIATGGSDFHGTGKDDPPPGSASTPPDEFYKILNSMHL